MRKKTIIIFSIICTLISVVFFLIPQSAFAIEVEPLFKVLATGTVGVQIKSVWNDVLMFVNSLAAAVLIFIAFANILRININNYGIKKFLPTLILTIIAANFSYLICRLLVDLANVACDLLITGTGAATATTTPDISASTKAVGGAFDFTTKNVTSFPEYPRIFILAILELVGAVFILILAFLFFIRNYIIYFLVVLAPIAFVSLSLPQTKTVFNQWWSNFWKWAFLPVVSLFWLWIAGRWIGTLFGVAGSSSILAVAFSGVCYYLAITTPFKMGGTIMQQWGNLGKKAWGATGGKIYDYQKAKNAATWGARWQNVQNAVKDTTGIGKGLDMAQQKLADSQTRRGLLQDEGKAAYIKKAGKKRALWQVQNMSKEGSTAFAEKEQLKNLITETDETGLRGLALRRARKSNRLVDKVEEMRTKSQAAMLDLAVFDADWNKFNNVLKTRFLQKKDAHGNDVPVGSDEYNRRVAFIEQYGNSLWRANVAEREATKSANDPIKNAAMERTAIDNIVQDKQKFDELLDSINRLVILERQAVRTAEEEQEREKLQIGLRAAGYSIDNPSDLQDSQEYIESRQRRAENNYYAKAQEYAQGAPVHVQDMITRDAAGNVTFNTFAGGNLERSRTGQYVNEEIKSGAAVLAEQYSMREIMNTLIHGDSREGIEQKHVDAYNQGRSGENPADINRKIQEFAVAARMTGGMSPQRPGAPIYVSEQLERLKAAAESPSGDITELKRLVHEINYSHRALRRQTPEVAPESESPEHLVAAITSYYGSNNENRKTVLNALNASAGLGNEGRPSNSLR